MRSNSRLLRATLALLVAGSASAPLVPLQASPPPSTKDVTADQRLRALYEEEWAWRQKAVGNESEKNDGRNLSLRLPRVDPATQAARLSYWLDVLRRLNAIPADQLSPGERDNADVFRAVLEGFIVDQKFKSYEAPFNSDTFFWSEFTPRQGFSTTEEYRAYIQRLRDIPRYFDEQIMNMRAGVKRRFTPPAVSIIGRDKTIEPYLLLGEQSPLWVPIANMPANIPDAERTSIEADARAAISELAAPAYCRLLEFLRKEYYPNARQDLAASKLPNGSAFYQGMVEKFTTLELTPAEIHNIGLSEVARISGDMQATMESTGFKGDLGAFRDFLRTDPRFYAKTPHELLAEAAYIVKKADLKLKDTIGFLPRHRHGILPVPEALAPIYTGGRGGLDSCLFNTFNLPARPLYTLPALALHECTPGHSFEAALALEREERPAFRNDTYFSGYSEGWGLYTEWLGTVMDIYETPYEEFGRQTYEMWRAVRLVVDTGIHHYGWSRERAVAYMKEHLALSDHEINTEVDRYISWPGQAVSYKLGELQIRRHRREAEAALGAKFDQRKFHDAILSLGSVPLPVLERRMKQFIADGGENPSRPGERAVSYD